MLWLVLILIIAPLEANAEENLLTDDFIDTTYVDTSKTTATVATDEEGGVVRLPARSLVNAIAVQDESPGYAVATSTGIVMYDYNDATQNIVQNNAFSVPGVTDAIGISLRQDNLNVWAVTESSVSYYKFNGSSMSEDPALKVSGLHDVLSIAAFKNKDKALVLQKDASKAKITQYEDNGSLTAIDSFQYDIADPIAISIVDSSPDFVLTSETSQYYFMYDDATSNYVEDISKRLSLTDAVSSSANAVGSVVATDSELTYYINNDNGSPESITAYSAGPVNNPVAVSLRSNNYEYAYVDKDGNVGYYLYDDYKDKMVRDTSLETNDLLLNSGFAHPKEYYSKVLTASKSYDAVLLTTSQNVPENTSIQYYISSDGGLSYVGCELGKWTSVTAGDKFVLKAVLDTTDTNITPKIYQVTLVVDDDFKVDADIDQMVERGRNCEVTAEVTRLTSNEIVSVDRVEVIVPVDNLAPGDSPITGTMTYNASDKKWHFTFLVPELTLRGYWPDDGNYQARVTAYKGSTFKNDLVDFDVDGHLYRRFVIRTVSW